MYLFQGIWVELLSKLVAYDSLDGAEQAFERTLLGAKQGNRRGPSCAHTSRLAVMTPGSRASAFTRRPVRTLQASRHAADCLSFPYRVATPAPDPVVTLKSVAFGLYRVTLTRQTAHWFTRVVIRQ
jgi:hypothetical protein